jgi:hypothetical protein
MPLLSVVRRGVFGVALALAFCPALVAVPEVAGVAAFVHSGQTFLTWHQSEDPAARYDIHRNGRRIATVGAHTSLNVMASVDRLKLSATRPPNVYELPERIYFVIREGEPPLNPTTGLFVYTAKEDAEATYAVTPAGEAPPSGAGARVSERVEFPAAVRQNETDYVHWTDDVGTPLYPAMSSLPGVPYNFRVRLPAGEGPFPLIAFLHGALLDYRKTQLGGEAEAGAIRIALDSPIIYGGIKGLEGERWPAGAWHGYNENFGTDRPEDTGRVIPYVERRVLWTLDWAQRTFRVDPDRVSLRGGSMGGIGALVIGLTHRDRFAAIHAHIPPLRIPARSGFAGLMLPVVPADWIAAHPRTELPFLLITAGRTDQIVGWPDKLEFATALRSAHAGFALYWDLRNHDGTFAGDPPASLAGPPVVWGRVPGLPEMSVTTFSRRQSFPAFDRLTADSDPGTVNFGVRPAQRPAFTTAGAGDFIGSFNGAADWDRTSIVDTSDRWEATLRLLPITKSGTATVSVTPRRTQQFHPEPGTVFHYRATGAGEFSGQVAADEFGRVTVPAVPLTPDGVRLEIWRGR